IELAAGEPGVGHREQLALRERDGRGDRGLGNESEPDRSCPQSGDEQQTKTGRVHAKPPDPWKKGDRNHFEAAMVVPATPTSDSTPKVVRKRRSTVSALASPESPAPKCRLGLPLPAGACDMPGARGGDGPEAGRPNPAPAILRATVS